MAESKYIKLSGNYYFDPVNRHILKKQGAGYSFVRHDRRLGNKPVVKDRRDKFEAMPVEMRPITHGLYWDPEGKNVYRKIGNNFVLYSKDRRKTSGQSPTGADRRRT
jgi:hypothetical protein